MDPKKMPHNAETTYVDPYGDDCQPIAQPNLRTGEDPKYVAEVWWQIGNWEFDQLDARAGVTDDEPVGVWDLNRAASAYQKALKFKKPPLYSVSLYKYAWTVFKQQRYDAATRQFVLLLLHTDDLEKTRGDANVSDFRNEAYTYIANSLTNVDFIGPAPEDPYIQRPDVVDSIPDPLQAEKALHVAIDRVKDPTLIPQDKPWTIEIYKALAAEFRSLNQFNNAIEIYDLILKKWPMDPTAPDVQNEIALTYDQMGLTGNKKPAERDALAAKALDARTNLANYVGDKPWVDANKDNPDAIHNAERLAHGGLRSAAAAHTNNGKQLLVMATQAASEKEALDDLSRSLAEYKLAAIGWEGYLLQPDTQSSPDAYDSRFWLADARNKQVRVQMLLHAKKKDQFPEPTPKEIDLAKAAAIDVRDSNEDDKYLNVAAQFVVEESDVLVDLDNAHYADSKGTQGYPKRTELEMVGTGDTATVKQVPIPANLLSSMKARDEYVAHVPPEKDTADAKGVLNATIFQFDVADTYFVYGDFNNAKARFEPLYRDHCGKDEYGQKAWVKLISMAAKQNDAVRARQLAEADKAHSCAVGGRKSCTKKSDCGTDEDCVENACRSTLSTDIFQAAGYQDADKKFIEACGRDLVKPEDKCDPVTDANKPAWKDTAKLYNDALQAAPGRREAPRAAMRAAYAFKQLGDYNSAIKAYEQFIAEYGKEDTLKTLNGEKKGTAGDPKQYTERLGFLNIAYDELGTTFYSFFNYPKAAETYERIAQIPRFTEDKRKTAAKNAMILFNAIGQRDRMLNMYKIVVALRPTAEEKANYDYLVASFDYQQWNPNGGDAGNNRVNRQNAELAMSGFYNTNKGNPAAAKYSLEAAWRVAKMKKSAGDTGYHQWFTNTIAAWQFLNLHASTTAAGKESDQQPYTDYGAEAEYTLLDEEIHDKFDNATGHHKYSSMNSEQILGKIDTKTGQFVSTGAYKADVAVADSYDVKLKHIVETYHSLEFNPAALARSGTLYDNLRSALYVCAGSAFNATLIPPQFKAILTQMRNSGRDDLVDKADQLTDMVKDGWKNKRGREMEAADEVMVRNYAKAIQLARTYNTKHPAVTNAIARLAFFTDSGTELGEGPKTCIPPPKGAPPDPPGTGTGPGHMCGMAAYVNNTGDPTDTAKPPTRKLSYTPLMYLQMRPGLPAVLPENGAAIPLPVGVQ
jgi:tetratricopeptide (TPR) repeat protein